MLGDAAEYAGALVLPLLFIGALAAIVITGLAAVLETRNRFLRIAYAGLGALLAVSSAWLIVYAGGADTYYEPDQVSRWEHAQRFIGIWPVVLAVIGAAATSLALFVSALSRTRRDLSLLAAPGAALSCLLVIFGWFALTAGH